MRNPAVAQVTIRPIEPCDIEAVQHVLIATWHATYDATLGRSKVDEVAAAWHSPAALEQQLRATGSTFLLAEDCSGVLGCGFARVPGFGCAQIGQLYVLPRAQGRGCCPNQGISVLSRWSECHKIAGLVSEGNRGHRPRQLRPMEQDASWLRRRW